MRDRVKYFTARLAELLLTLFIVSLFTFFAFSVIPGDTASVILGPEATQEQLDSLRADMGLDKPLVERYFNWIGGVFVGQLGESTAFSQPVSNLILERLPVTLGLSLIAIIIVIAVAYPLAVISSRRPGRFADQIVSVICHIAFAVPPFVLSLLLILFFCNAFGVFSVGQYTAPTENFGSYLLCLLLPAVCIAIPKIAMIFKFLRSSILSEKGADYVNTAKSHGLSDMKIMLSHILPNSNVSGLTVISIVLSDILGGSLIVEQVFNLPGLGRLLLFGISRRDFPLMSGMVLYLAIITVLLFFITDILCGLADPRIRLK